MLQNYFVRVDSASLHAGSPYPKLWIDRANWLMRRSRAVGSQLFKTKSPERLMAEAAAPERQMKRTFNAFDLTCIGIGAIIGTRIFALIGTRSEERRVGKGCK